MRADGCYLDGTFGRGGHSRLILSQLGPDGRSSGSTKTPKRLPPGKKLAAEDGRFVVKRSFAELGAEVAERGMAAGGGRVLLDLGVSSPQLDDPERGFSFMNDGPLDMRMDPTRGVSAAQFIATAPVEEIAVCSRNTVKNVSPDAWRVPWSSAVKSSRSSAPPTWPKC